MTKFKGYEIVKMLSDEEILEGTIIELLDKDNDCITELEVKYDDNYWLYDTNECCELPSSYLTTNNNTFCFD